MVLYESDPLDDEEARGSSLITVAVGQIDRTEIQLPTDEKVYECADCRN